jgi:hypothetical protein
MTVVSEIVIANIWHEARCNLVQECFGHQPQSSLSILRLRENERALLRWH